ncbi:MAG: circularly permuted type 2 ATP-grasp protein [Methylocella sp.]
MILNKERKRLGDGRCFDEMTLADGEIRRVYGKIARWLATTPSDHLASRSAQAELLFRRMGITFAVYGEKDAGERLIPFDIIPRVMLRSEWARLEAGLVQRVNAINLFLADVYGGQEIIKAGRIPAELVLGNAEFRPEMVGHPVPHNIYVQIAGIDVVRTGEDDFYVLEDNVRTPSGVSYMLENREVMMRLMPDLFAEHRVAPVENYPDALLAALRSVAPDAAKGERTIALLTPGRFNSAYYEHSFLADKLGVELVEGRDLFVADDKVYMRTTEGAKQIDVLYRRIDDQFLDPEAFRADSVLGVAGLMRAYRAGNVTLANAVGTGVGDDKAIYTYMPEIIDFYLGEKALLKNVPTWRCREPEALRYVLANLADLVVKEVNGSGGYGMLVGPHATKAARELFAAKLAKDPSNFIAQPTLALSTTPTFFEAGVAPRHVDLRPFVLTGANGVRVMPGGLTRVALIENSLVVNSSQGGGTKDTWIVDDSIFEESALFQRQNQSQHNYRSAVKTY